MKTSRRIEKARHELLKAVTLRRDGKSPTPSGLPRELILGRLEQAGRTGMTQFEIAQEYPHRATSSYKMFKDMECKGQIDK